MGFGKWIGFIAFVFALYILWQIRQLLLVIFTAVVVANALSLLVKRFQASGLKRSYAVLLSVITFLTILAVFFLLIIPPFTAQLEELFELVPRGIEQLSGWLSVLEQRLDPQFNDLFPTFEQLRQQLQPLAEELLGGGLVFFSTSVGALLNLLLIVVLTLMILSEPDPYRQGFIRLFPSFYRRRVDEILVKCQQGLQGWLVGILFNMAVITVLSFIGLFALNIPLALSQALLAGLLTFIPNIGPALSVIPPMAIALLDEPWKAVAVLVLYVVIQQVETNLLTPLVMAQQVSLLPVFTLLAQLFFTSFFGFFGLFLALPLTVIGQVWLKEVLVKDVLDNWQGRSARLPDSSVIEDKYSLPKEEYPSVAELEEVSDTPPSDLQPFPDSIPSEGEGEGEEEIS